MSKRQTRAQDIGKTVEKKNLPNSSATALFRALADFEYLYTEGGEARVVSGKQGEPFAPPAGWVRDGGFFVLPDERRVRLPVE